MGRFSGGSPLRSAGSLLCRAFPKSTSPLAAVSARPYQRGSSEAVCIGIERGVGGLMADIVEFRGGADKYRTGRRGTIEKLAVDRGARVGGKREAASG